MKLELCTLTCEPIYTLLDQTFCVRMQNCPGTVKKFKTFCLVIMWTGLQQCFTGKYTTCKIPTKLDLVPTGVHLHVMFISSNIVTVRILMMSFPAFSQLFVQSVSLPV